MKKITITRGTVSAINETRKGWGTYSLMISRKTGQVWVDVNIGTNFRVYHNCDVVNLFTMKWNSGKTSRAEILRYAEECMKCKTIDDWEAKKEELILSESNA